MKVVLVQSRESAEQLAVESAWQDYVVMYEVSNNEKSQTFLLCGQEMISRQVYDIFRSRREMIIAGELWSVSSPHSAITSLYRLMKNHQGAFVFTDKR